MYGISLETAAAVLLVTGLLLVLAARPHRSPPPLRVEVTVPRCDCHRPVLEQPTMLLPLYEAPAHWEVTAGYLVPEDPWAETVIFDYAAT